MTDGPILLPSNATGYERAHDGTDAARWPLDVSIIRDTKDAMRCPEALLPLLAWERGVDIWDDRWPVEKKRYVVEHAYKLHRLKGTLEGVRRYVGLSGGKLVGAIVPPDKPFLMPALTAEERAEFLARFPQLRIYMYRQREKDRYITTTRGSMRLPKSYVGYMYPYDTRALDRHRREARLWDRGEETVLTHREFRRETYDGSAYDYEEIVLPQVASTAIYLGQRPKARMFFGESGIRQRLVTVRVDRAYAYALGDRMYRTVYPSLQPIQIEPELVHERHGRTRGAAFLGVRGQRTGKSFVGRGLYLPPTIAGAHIYERTYLWDKTRLPGERRRPTFVGHFRLGMPAHNAQIEVEIRRTWPSWRMGRFCTGFVVASSRETLDAVRHGAFLAQSARDKVLMDTKTVRRPRVGDRLRLGFKLGDFVKD